ncbi:hypothetical protein BKA70DRAFT_1437199 [Coprinopsis sp. MPI-PUGE-AT-0042]|nr:hypothetical protein BKA70DRAFT_1437199 [Coprinopsis sp. MPI-PUGE-AT-0042]
MALTATVNDFDIDDSMAERGFHGRRSVLAATKLPPVTSTASAPSNVDDDLRDVEDAPCC